MLEKFGVHITPFLGAGSGKNRGKVAGSKGIRLEERNIGQQQCVHENAVAAATEETQFSVITPHLELDMALVLVLVQDNSVALNTAKAPPTRPTSSRLAPPTAETSE